MKFQKAYHQYPPSESLSSSVVPGSRVSEGTKEDSKLLKKVAIQITQFTYSPLINSRGIKGERPVKGFRTFYITPEDETTKPPAPKCVQPPPLPEEAKIEAVLIGSERRPPTEPQKYFYEPLQLLRKPRELAKKSDGAAVARIDDARKTAIMSRKRELAELHTVCVPKTGAIKLTGLVYELDSPLISDDRKELAVRREKKRYHQELIGLIPKQPSDVQHGQRIQDITLIEQLREGEKRFVDKQEEALKGESLSIRGLLMYEMPEAPTLNSSIQKFVEDNTNYNNSVRVVSTDQFQSTDPSQMSNTENLLIKPFHEFGNLSQQKIPSVSTGNLSQMDAIDVKNHIKNNTCNKNIKCGKALNDLWNGSENKEISTLHQVLVKAQNINLSCTEKHLHINN